YLLFFFSSRRRHTRFSRDWSSDVCSSDLAGADLAFLQLVQEGLALLRLLLLQVGTAAEHDVVAVAVELDDLGLDLLADERLQVKIGRASCREREENKVVVGS